MRKILLILGMIASPAICRASTNDIYDPARNVCQSSVTIQIVNVSTYTATQLDSAQLQGSFAVEVQDIDSSADACCSFDVNQTTTTANGSHGCRRVVHNFGTWPVNRWWQNLILYCQSLGTTAATAVALVSCK